MNQRVSILSITGLDCMGGVGIQADANTIMNMGANALTVITAITVQSENKIKEIHYLDTNLIIEQVQSTIANLHPRALKVGLVGNPNTIKALRNEIIGCKNIVLDFCIITSSGRYTMNQDAIKAYVHYLLPLSSLLMLKCKEAELLLNRKIQSDEDMIEAAQKLVELGTQWVLLRGGSHTEGQLTALLYGEGKKKFFTSYNMEGWQKHGVSSALSTAIATRLGLGDNMETAISKAHEYIHSQVVYALNTLSYSPRGGDLYNQFLSLIADNYAHAHDVNFYADKLCITARYLNQITIKTVNKSPKQVIDDYLMQESKILLNTSRMTIQEISNRLGFSSQAMFCRFFKNIEGCTPSYFSNYLS